MKKQVNFLAKIKQNVSNLRKNTNPSPLEDEIFMGRNTRAYCDPLILHSHDNFNNKIDKRMSMMLDPLISAITVGWATLACAKTFKFYDNHGPDGQEVMEEYRQWWIASDLNEILMAAIPHLSLDGWVLYDPYINDEGKFDYNIYGSYECSSVNWKRDAGNKIEFYNVRYIPRPVPGVGVAGGLRAVTKVYPAERLFHLTRGDWNLGFGKSRVMPCWDPAVKMRHGSHADFFRRDIRFMVAVPQNWKTKRKQAFMDAFSEMMRGQRRSFIYNMEQSKGPDQTPLGLPSFGFESLAKQAAPKPYAQSESGGQLLRDPEWARFLTACEHTENYFIGNQAGAMTGSEVDLTRDFYTECKEFALIEPLIKAIVNWFAELGVIPAPPQDYVVKYWKDWEHIEMGRALAQQEMDLQQQRNTPNRENANECVSRKIKIISKEHPDWKHDKVVAVAYSYCEKHNTLVAEDLLRSIRLNRSMPMTPVMSSWIKGIGYRDGTLFFETHDQTADAGKYGYYDVGELEAERLAMEWFESGSKGEFWHEAIKGVLSPARKMGRIPLPKMLGSKEYEKQAKQMREEKMEPSTYTSATKPGTTAAPFTTPRSTPSKSTAQWTGTSPSDTMYRKPEYQLYNSDASVPTLLKIGKEMGWNMSKNTAYNIIDLLRYNKQKHRPRYNSWIAGNPMDFDVILRYPDNPNGEKACKKEWKKINAHSGDLVIYDDLGHGGRAHKIGTYEYFWSEEQDRPVMIYEKESVYERLNAILEEMGQQDSMLYLKIQNNEPPSISTEYYAGSKIHEGVEYQVNFHDSNFEPRFERIAFVNAGNCDAPHCTFKEVEEARKNTVAELIEWVKTHVTTDDPESVAFAIINSKEEEESWEQTWGRIGAEFDKRREARRGKT